MRKSLIQCRRWALFWTYLIAHGGILFLPNAIYWDDWTLVNVGRHNILGAFEQAGAFLNVTGYMHVGMLSAGPILYRLSTFTLLLANGYLLRQILLV